MAGTLLRLKDAGCELHYLNLADGCAGSAELSPEEIAAVRLREAKNAAAYLGARFHPPFVHDLEVFYEQELIRKVTAVVRQVQPGIVLVPSLEDYMEDHMNTARVAVTAVFLRGVKNYPSVPAEPPVLEDVMVYHALPHILTDWMRRPLVPELYVDIGAVIDRKERMLACHVSQKEWLDKTQGLDSYLAAMRATAARVGTMSGRYRYAEGWRRHHHVGFSRQDMDPLSDLLGR